MERKINKHIETLTGFTRFGGSKNITGLWGYLLPCLSSDVAWREDRKFEIMKQFMMNKEFVKINNLADNEMVVVYNNNRNAFVVGTKKYIISVIYTGDYKKMVDFHWVVDPNKIEVTIKNRKTEFKYN